MVNYDSLAAVLLVGALCVVLFAAMWPGVDAASDTIAGLDGWEDSGNDQVDQGQAATYEYAQNLPLIVTAGLAMLNILAGREGA